MTEILFARKTDTDALSAVVITAGDYLTGGGSLTGPLTIDVDFASIAADIHTAHAIGTLSRTNDTNITLTIGGTPTNALFNDVSLTLGWSGTLANSRLTNSAVTISGHALSLGGSLALAQADITGLTTADSPLFTGLTSGTVVLKTPGSQLRLRISGSSINGADLGITNASDSGTVFNFSDWDTGLKGFKLDTSTGNIGINTDPAVSGEAKLDLRGPSFTRWETAIWSGTLGARIGTNLNGAGTGTLGSANQFGLTVQVRVDPTSSAASYEKGVITAVGRQFDPSVLPITRDLALFFAYGQIDSSVPYGRIWGQHINVGAAGDGQIIGTEYDLQPSADHDWADFINNGKATFGQYITGGDATTPGTVGSLYRQAWHFAIAADTTLTDPGSGNRYFLYLGDMSAATVGTPKFSVDYDGNQKVQDISAQGAITLGTAAGTSSYIQLGGVASTPGAPLSGYFRLYANASGDLSWRKTDTYTRTLTSTLTGNRTYILPDANDTLVGKATTDELTNKTLTASVGKGTWTASGTWTLPALTLGGSVSGGGQTITNLASVAIRDTSASFDVTVAAASSTALTAGRTLTIDMVNAARTIKLSGSPTLNDWFDQNVKSTASPTFAALVITSAANYVRMEKTTNTLSSDDLVLASTGSGSNIFFLADYQTNTKGLSVNTSSGLLTALTSFTAAGTTDATSTATGAVTSSGGLGVAKSAWFGGPVVHKSYTVATLPAAASYQYGIAFVTDATLTTITGLGLAPTGGGANKVPVYSDGTNWIML
jgi:hypothetical protein